MQELLTGETLEAWNQRCVPSLIAEGKGYDEALSQCTLMHEEFQKVTDPELREVSKVGQETEIAPIININIGKFKLETKQIKNVEILKAGRYKGTDYTEKDLDLFVENFNNKIAEPTLTLDHDEKLTDSVSKEFKVAALGYVESLKRVGDKLYADFKQVPKLIAELIEAGPLKQRSVEFFKAFKTSSGTTLKNVLTGVTFFGSGLPAVAGMSDLMELFKENSNGVNNTVNDRSDESVHVKILFQEPQMEKIEISKDEYEKLLAIKKEYDAMKKSEPEGKAKFKDIESELEKFKDENSSLKSELETAKKTTEEFEKFKADSAKKEAEDYIDSKIADKKLLPKFRDFKVAEYLTFKADAEKLTVFKEDIESRADVIPENYQDGSNGSSVETFKTNEDASTAFEKLINQGKTPTEAFKILGMTKGV
jgi:hypothetical protein